MPTTSKELADEIATLPSDQRDAVLAKLDDLNAQCRWSFRDTGITLMVEDTAGLCPPRRATDAERQLWAILHWEPSADA